MTDRNQHSQIKVDLEYIVVGPMPVPVPRPRPGGRGKYVYKLNLQEFKKRVLYTVYG